MKNFSGKKIKEIELSIEILQSRENGFFNPESYERLAASYVVKHVELYLKIKQACGLDSSTDCETL
jgi:hypothetical protein